MSVKVIAFVTVQPGKEDAFVAAAAQGIAKSRAEPGVLRYDLWREPHGERRFVFDELYTDDAAVQVHMASDHFKELGKALREVVAARPAVTILHTSDVAAAGGDGTAQAPPDVGRSH